MCKTPMPRKLLQLFFEPRQAPAGAIEGSTESNPNPNPPLLLPESEAGAETGTAENQPVSAEITGLRRELASTRKVRYLLWSVFSQSCCFPCLLHALHALHALTLGTAIVQGGRLKKK